ncbi:methyltransferase [Afifella sp. IM 167]|nr:methyltransferase [Afifella sp. IM 167]
MADPARAIGAFRAHYDKANAVRPMRPGFTVLELGPGDSLLSAGVAKAFGASRTYLVDAGRFADESPALFYDLERALSRDGLGSLSLPADAGMEEILAALGARYLTQGVRSLATIPDASVDLIWSSVVLEHVFADEFDAMAAEFARILAPDGVMSHAVDLRDHLGGGLNNLRFSPERWESPGWRGAGFYTNRMSQAEIVEAFTRAGFSTVELESALWPQMPIERAALHETFRGRSDEELRICEFDLVMVHGTPGGRGRGNDG